MHFKSFFYKYIILHPSLDNNFLNKIKRFHMPVYGSAGSRLLARLPVGLNLTASANTMVPWSSCARLSCCCRMDKGKEKKSI